MGSGYTHVAVRKALALIFLMKMVDKSFVFFLSSFRGGNMKKHVFVKYFSYVAIFVLSACGGGGGGGGPEQVLYQIPYTGISTAALITENNAETLVLGSFLGPPVLTGGVVPLHEGSDVSPSNRRWNSTPSFVRETILNGLERSIERSDPESASPMETTVTRPSATEEWTEQGLCGGTASYSLTVNEGTGDIGGNVTFADYNDCESVMTGSASISGNIDPVMLSYRWMNLHIGIITVVSAGESFSLSGTMESDWQVFPMTVTLNLRIRDDGTGGVFWYEDYVTTDGMSGPYTEMTIAGKYYDPAHGFVVLSTDNPFHTDTAGTWPFEGVLRATGGSASKAWLIAVDSFLYRVEADTNGDDTPEFVGQNLHWPGANREPISDGTVDQYGNVGCPVNLVGKGFDADGDTLAYSWQIVSAPEGSTAVLSGDSSAKPSFFPDVQGEYLFEVSVSDGYAESRVPLGPISVGGGRFCSGNGSGLVPVGSQGNGVAIGDVNGDGRNDIVFVTGYYDSPDNDGKLFVLLQDTSGGMSSPIRYDLPSSFSNWPASVAVGDLNHDGRNDLAVGIDRYGIQIFLQNSLGGLDLSSLISAWDSSIVRIADLDNDGREDLAGMAWGSNTATVWYQDVAGILGSPVTYDVNHGGNDDLELEDLNNDGRKDMVVMSGQGYDNFGVLLQNVVGGLSSPVYYDLGVSSLSYGLATADLTGDGLRDVALSHLGWISVFPQNVSGTLDPPVGYPFFEGGSGDVSTGDFDSDGRTDLAGGYGESGIGVFYQRTDGTLFPFDFYRLPLSTAGGYGIRSLTVGDINGDGRDDVVGGLWDGIVIFRNTGRM